MKNKQRTRQELPENLNFHYSRDERYSLLTDKEKENLNPKKEGFFKRNKSTKIIILDILIIALFFGGFAIYQRITHDKIDSANYKFKLSGFVYEKKLMISLAAEKKAETPEENIEIIFTAIGKEVKLYEILPEKIGEIKIFRASVPIEKEIGSDFDLAAEIKIGKEQKAWKIKVKNEYE